MASRRSHGVAKLPIETSKHECPLNFVACSRLYRYIDAAIGCGVCLKDFGSGFVKHVYDLLAIYRVRPRQNEDTLSRQHCSLRCRPSVAKRGNIVARRADTRNASEDFQKHFLCPEHKICVRHKCCARGKTNQHFWKHDHVINVAATMCPRFSGPLVTHPACGA